MHRDNHENDTAREGHLRLFATLQLTNAAARELHGYARAETTGHDEVRPVAIEHLHVTFAWLGDVAESQVSVIATALDAAASLVPGATSCTAGDALTLGAGSVVAAAVEFDHDAELRAARADLLDVVGQFAPLIDRRPWAPHVTLVRRVGRGALPQGFADAVADPPRVQWRASSLVLMSSVESPFGRQHFPVHSAELGADGGISGLGRQHGSDAM